MQVIARRETVISYRKNGFSAPLGIEIAAQSDVCPALAVEETGETFAENAFFKAQAVHRLTGKAAVADDSGLCVDALGGAPGVYSARYGGEDLPHSEKIKLLLKELIQVPDEKRTARFGRAYLLHRRGRDAHRRGGMLRRRHRPCAARGGRLRLRSDFHGWG